MTSSTNAPGRTRLRPRLLAILAILAPLSATGSTFSGWIVTADGMPGVDMVVLLRPTQVHDDGGLVQAVDNSWQAATNADGSFAFDAVPEGAVALVVTREGASGEPSAWVRTIDSGGVSFHAHSRFGFVFTLSPDTDFEDVTIAVVKRSVVSGRVLEADGSPVANARLDSKHEHRRVRGRGSNSGSLSTDELGRYSVWLDDIATHTITVSRGAESATRVFVTQRPGEEIHGVDLVLGETTPERLLTEWVENPANAHSYRLIEEDGWFNSQKTADAMHAHLVTISDAAEMAWLVSTFGDAEPYWIGLTDERAEGEWEWVTGEPLDYTNWSESQPADGFATGADYALMSWLPYPDPRGRWRAVDPTGSDWHRVRRAIVERDPVKQGAPGIIVTPMRQSVFVAPGTVGIVELVVRNPSERERLMTFRVAEAVTDDAGVVTEREGAAGLLALVDPDAMARPFAPWGTRTIRLRAGLPHDADTPRTVHAIFGVGLEREPERPAEPTSVTIRVASQIEIVPKND